MFTEKPKPCKGNFSNQMDTNDEPFTSRNYEEPPYELRKLSENSPFLDEDNCLTGRSRNSVSKNLIGINDLKGLERRIALQHKLVASIRKIERDLISFSSEFNSYIIPTKITEYESIEKYEDTLPFLSFRKALQRIKVSISELSKIFINNSVFETFIICVIILNVIFLAIEDENNNNTTIAGLERFFLFTYTAECILKICAHGFIMKPSSYIRDWWNILDFSIVITSWVSILYGNSPRLTSLRVLRILRPLRGVSSIEGMRVLILSIIMSIKPFVISLIVLFIFISLFAIIGLLIWSGSFRNQCIDIHFGTFGKLCGASENCGLGEQCAYTIGNPRYNTLSFDNFFYASLIVFQIITLEGWSQIMVYAQNSFSYFSLLYFVPLIIFGSMLIYNLSVAALISSFTSALSRNEVKKAVVEKYALGEVITKWRKQHSRKTVKPYDILFQNKVLSDEKISNEKNDLQIIDCNESGIERIEKNFSEFGNSSQINGMAACLMWRTSEKYYYETQKAFDYSRPVSIRVNQLKVDEQLLLNEKSVLHSESVGNLLEIREKFVFADGFYQDLQVLSKTKLEIQNLIEKYSDFTKFQLHRLESLKFGKKQAFLSLNIPSKSIVDYVRKSKKFQNSGEWSGDDVGIYNLSLSDFAKSTLTSLEFTSQNSFLRFFLLVNLFFTMISKSKAFNIFMSLLVSVNTVVLASDHYGISNEQFQVLTQLNSICTIAFMIELVIKVIGLGIKGYFRDHMNTLDMIIVTLSLIDYFLSESRAFNALRALRIIRLLRVLKVFRIFRYLKSMAQLIRMITISMSQFLYLFLFLLLLLIIFSMLGMEIFRHKFNFSNGLPRNNFDSFHWAFATMFQVLSTESWDQVMQECMRSSVGHWSVIFLLVWIIIGNFVLLNLFLGILLSGFESDEDPDGLASMIKNSKEQIFKSYKRKNARKNAIREEIMKEFNEESMDEINTLNDLKALTLKKTQTHLVQKAAVLSYCYLTKENSFRKFLLKVALSDKFEAVIVVIIILNMAKLVWGTYIISYPNDSFSVIMSTAFDSIFTLLYLIEFLIKSIGLGFAFEKGSYLRNPWNQLDFVILILSCLDVILISVSINVVKVFRSLRILRPLKLIRYNTSMKIILNALFESFLASINVIAVISVIWLIFAILGVSLFNGKLYSCENPLLDNIGDCIDSGFAWKNNSFNYDNILEALLTLFVISSQEAWPDRMFDVVDAFDIYKAPVKNANPAAAYFVIIYVFIGDFFLVNLFTVIVYSKFSEAKRDQSSITSLLLSKNQITWIEIQQLVLKSKPLLTEKMRTANRIRNFTTSIVSSPKFKLYMFIVIIINTIQMAVTYEGSSENYNYVLEIINEVCTFIFILEAFLKVVSSGIHDYFAHNWNKFDFFVVSTSSLFLILESFISQNMTILKFGPQLIRILRVLRISRIFKVFSSLQYLQDLFGVILFSLPSALNVLCLMLLVFMIYAILGVNLFWQVSGTFINESWNFSNFHMAMLILWRMSTGEDYPYIMAECTNYYNTKTISIYFTTFITISTFILMEFFVSVIIQNYRDFMENPISAVFIVNNVVKKFKLLWFKYSKESEGIRAHHTCIAKLMIDLGPEFGITGAFREETICKLLHAMRITIDKQGFVHYNDMLYALVRRKYSRKLAVTKEKFISKILCKEEVSVYRKLEEIRFQQLQKCASGPAEIENPPKLSLIDIYFAKIIFSAWKHYAVKKIRMKSRK